MYVGITRAKRRLTITSAARRMIRGETEYHSVSRFVEEIPREMLDGDFGFAEERPRERFGAMSGDRSFSRPVHINGTAPSEKPKNYHYQIKNDPKVMAAKIEKLPLDYGVGDRVSHIKFGEGTVKDIIDGGRDYEVTVVFDSVGQKKMFASFAKLQKN